MKKHSILEEIEPKYIVKKLNQLRKGEKQECYFEKTDEDLIIIAKDHEVIAKLFFNDSRRVAQNRLLKLYQAKLLNRYQHSKIEQYCYYKGTRPKNLAHALKVSEIIAEFLTHDKIEVIKYTLETSFKFNDKAIKPDIFICYKDSDEEIFVIGGGSIYSLFLEYSDKLKHAYTIRKNGMDFNRNNLEISFTSPGWIDETNLKHLKLITPSCGACLSNMAIAPNGEVIPCQSWLSKDSLGNLLDTSFNKIWRSKRCKQIRKQSIKKENQCPLAIKEVK